MNSLNTTHLLNKGFALMLAAFAFVFTAKAQTAGAWNFNGSLSGTPGAHLSNGAAVLGSDIPTGTFNGGTEYYGEGGWPSGGIDPNAYLQISLTAGSGYYLSLTSLVIKERRSNTGTPAGAGPNNWSIRSSLDNYASDITSGTMTYNYAVYNVTLPAAFQSIPTSVTFRIYGYNATVNSGGFSRMVFDSIVVSGQAVSGVLAEQSILVSAKSAGPGLVDLGWNLAGFAAGTDLSLERSVNGQDFTSIFREQSASVNTYSYEDATAPATGSVFYRVTATNPDGSLYRSSIIALQQSSAQQTQIKAVVAQGNAVQTLLHIGESGTYQLSVFSRDGKALTKQSVNGQAGDLLTDITLGAQPHGIYILTLAGEGTHSSRQFVF